MSILSDAMETDITMGTPRPFVGVVLQCCHVYVRLYVNAAGDRFTGWCPKCLKQVEILLSEEGTTDRFFVAQ